MSELTAVHWWYVYSGKLKKGQRTRRTLECYLKLSERCSHDPTCQGWVYKVSDGRWVGVLAEPRTIKFYPTEEAAVTSIMLRGG